MPTTFLIIKALIIINLVKTIYCSGHSDKLKCLEAQIKHKFAQEECSSADNSVPRFNQVSFTSLIKRLTTSIPTSASEEHQCISGRDQESKWAELDFYARNLTTLKIKYSMLTSIWQETTFLYTEYKAFYGTLYLQNVFRVL